MCVRVCVFSLFLRFLTTLSLRDRAGQVAFVEVKQSNHLHASLKTKALGRESGSRAPQIFIHACVLFCKTYLICGNITHFNVNVFFDMVDGVQNSPRGKGKLAIPQTSANVIWFNKCCPLYDSHDTSCSSNNLWIFLPTLKIFVSCNSSNEESIKSHLTAI